PGCAWSYNPNAPDGPSHWGTCSSTCANTSTSQQSPINFPVAPAPFTGSPQGALALFDPAALVTVQNNGHTIQVNYPTPYTNKLTYNGTTYYLNQFHFHTPSEHTFGPNYSRSPLELHLVHTANSDGSGAILVLTVLINGGGTQPNPTFDQVLQNTPWGVGIPSAQFPNPPGFNVGGSAGPPVVPGLLPIAPNNNWNPYGIQFYMYTGSLTTPPCTEGITWIVLATSLQLTDAEVTQFRQLFSQGGT